MFDVPLLLANDADPMSLAAMAAVSGALWFWTICFPPQPSRREVDEQDEVGEELLPIADMV
jgi:hypothetical protein